MPGGMYDPGSLNVQIDAFAAPFGIPAANTNATITIEGVSFSNLLQSANYAGMNIQISAGMKAGLPLVNPSQAGVILKGQIYQSFGNWVGTDMNLNFILIPGGNTFANPGNFVLNWPANTPLADAIATMLNTAYPAYPRDMKIGTYVNDYPVLHHVNTLGKMSEWIKQRTKSATSPGVDIILLPTSSLLVTDQTTKPSAVQLAFTDLIGQPQWLGGDSNSAFLLQWTTVMRADIQVGSIVKMPKGLPYAPGAVTTTALANPYNQLKLATAFQGDFIVQSVRYVGNFRDSEGASWATVFKAYAAAVAP